MSRGVELTLYDADGNVYASGTDIAVMWFDSDEPPDLGRIVGTSGVASTSAGGVLTLDIEQVSGLSVGDFGFLILYKADGSDYKDSPVFASRVQVGTVTGGTVLSPVSSWVRPAAWLTLPALTGQIFAGLLAVFPEDNFVALSAAGNYTIDWGDGSSPSNVSSGVTSEKNIAYADAAATSDVGIADAVAVTFTDSGDTVNRTAHGFRNGQALACSSITTTTGISTYTRYYVVNRTTDAFQLSATVGGSALALTGDGSGSVYVPQYRQVVVTVTPNGSNLTALNLHIKHSQSGLVTNVGVNWIEVGVSAQYLTDLRVGVQTPGLATTDISVPRLAMVSLVACAVSSFSYMFAGCKSLQSVPLLDTSSGTNFSYMFNSCASLQSVPLLDTSSGTTFSSMFSGCASLQSVPLLDTSSGTNFSYMFNSCTSLQSVPLLDTSSGTNFSYMFNSCASLQSVPLLDTSSGTTFSSMFNSCTSLQSARVIGVSQAVSYSGCKLSGPALDDIYTGLATVVGKTITVTGNYGTATDTPSIATAKGWTVTG